MTNMSTGDDKLLLLEDGGGGGGGDDDDDDDALAYSRSGGCCGLTTELKEFFGRRGWAWHWFQARIFLAILGNLIFWVGAWNLWQYDCGLDHTAPGCTFNVTSGTAVIEHVGTGVHNPAFRSYVTSLVGILLLVLSDTLFMNAGIEGALFPSWHTASIKTTPRGKCITAARTLVAMLGTTACWSGLYAIMQNTALGQDWTFCEHNSTEFVGAASKTNAAAQCAPDFVIHFLIFGFGLLLLGLTGTYSSITFLYPDEETSLGDASPLQQFFGFEYVDPEEYTTNVRLWFSVRALISILGQTMLWISSTQALDYSKPVAGDRIERPLFYTCLGLLLMSATDALVGNSYLEEDEEIDDGDGAGEDASPDSGTSAMPPTAAAAPMLYEDALSVPSRLQLPARPAGALEPRSSSLGLPNDITVANTELFDIARSSRGRSGTITSYRTRTNTGALILPVDIDSAEPEPSFHADRYEFTRWHVRSFAALLGQIVWFYGSWTVVDTFAAGTATATAGPGAVLTYYTTERNLFMVVLGASILALCGNLMTNASLSLVPVYPGRDVSDA